MPRDQRCRRPQRLPPQPVYVNGAGPVRQAVSDATSAGRVPPRCTARGSRNSARREHLILSDRRREAEQATACHRNHRRKTPRRSAGETGDRRARGSILDSRPDRHLNSIPAPGIEANRSSTSRRAWPHALIVLDRGEGREAGWSLVTMPVTFSERCRGMLKLPRKPSQTGRASDRRRGRAGT